MYVKVNFTARKSPLTNGSHHQLTLKDLNSIMRHEAAGIATRWYDLGVELLDSNTAVLDVIKTSHQRDDDRCSDMFKTWIEMKPDACWNLLVVALNGIGMNAAAENIQHSKIKGMCDYVQCSHSIFFKIYLFMRLYRKVCSRQPRTCSHLIYA